MAKVTIYQGRLAFTKDFLRVRGTAEKVAMVREALPSFHIGGIFETHFEGVEAAEEAFDMTNNPCREHERITLERGGASVYPGNVVDVDGVKYLCLDIGWEVL